ncbi:30S ribosomal protein S5 [Candidatus Woesearchaeota archaeon]|jgi:small subunit ribosomal protein S5|nr:30S ribosomal protein S5 [Candidatus Woesearchaeota archaeon]
MAKQDKTKTETKKDAPEVKTEVAEAPVAEAIPVVEGEAVSLATEADGKVKEEPGEEKPRFVSNFDSDSWSPKTELGKSVKDGSITDINQVLDIGKKILEHQIIDILVPTLESDLLLIGQSKGKFGGGQRRAFKQTQKKTREGNKPSFSTMAVVGDHNGHVGVGFGKSRETVPAREKAFRKAKLAIVKIRRGCGSWQCNCNDAHSIPFKVEGKCGSVIVVLMPAPKGTGLCAGGEIAKILKLAGIEDVWSKTFGKTTSRINTIKATHAALQQLMKTKVKEGHYAKLNIAE